MVDEDDVFAMVMTFMKRLFTSNLDLLLSVGEGELDAIGVPGLEGGLLREDLEVTTPIELNGELDAIGVPGLEGGLLREDLEVTTPLLVGIEIELNDLM